MRGLFQRVYPLFTHFNIFVKILCTKDSSTKLRLCADSLGLLTQAFTYFKVRCHCRTHVHLVVHILLYCTLTLRPNTNHGPPRFQMPSDPMATNRVSARLRGKLLKARTSSSSSPTVRALKPKKATKVPASLKKKKATVSPKPHFTVARTPHFIPISVHDKGAFANKLHIGPSSGSGTANQSRTSNHALHPSEAVYNGPISHTPHITHRPPLLNPTKRPYRVSPAQSLESVTQAPPVKIPRDLQTPIFLDSTAKLKYTFSEFNKLPYATRRRKRDSIIISDVPGCYVTTNVTNLAYTALGCSSTKRCHVIPSCGDIISAAILKSSVSTIYIDSLDRVTSPAQHNAYAKYLRARQTPVRANAARGAKGKARRKVPVVPAPAFGEPVARVWSRNTLLMRRNIMKTPILDSFSSRSVMVYLKPIVGFSVSDTIFTVETQHTGNSAEDRDDYVANLQLITSWGVAPVFISSMRIAFDLPTQIIITDLRVVFEYLWHVALDLQVAAFLVQSPRPRAIIEAYLKSEYILIPSRAAYEDYTPNEDMVQLEKDLFNSSGRMIFTSNKYRPIINLLAWTNFNKEWPNTNERNQERCSSITTYNMPLIPMVLSAVYGDFPDAGTEAGRIWIDDPSELMILIVAYADENFLGDQCLEAFYRVWPRCFNSPVRHNTDNSARAITWFAESGSIRTNSMYLPTINVTSVKHIHLQASSGSVVYKRDAITNLQATITADRLSATNGKASIIAQGWSLCQIVTGLFWGQFQALGFDWTTYRSYIRVIKSCINLDNVSRRLFEATSSAYICQFDAAIIVSLNSIFGITLPPSSAPYRHVTLLSLVAPDDVPTQGASTASFMDEATTLYGWVDIMISVPQQMAFSRTSAVVNFHHSMEWKDGVSSPVAWNGALYLPSSQLLESMEFGNTCTISPLLAELSALIYFLVSWTRHNFWLLNGRQTELPTGGEDANDDNDLWPWVDFRAVVSRIKFVEVIYDYRSKTVSIGLPEAVEDIKPEWNDMARALSFNTMRHVNATRYARFNAIFPHLDISTVSRAALAPLLVYMTTPTTAACPMLDVGIYTVSS